MLQIDLVDSLSSDAREAIETALATFNSQQNSIFWNARELPTNAPRPLYVVARDANHRAIGGLIGDTQFKWLKISLMSIEPAARGQGIGQAMLKIAEAEAIRRQCQYAYADTMDYQAPAFYERLGYTIVGRLDDWDSHGHSKLFFQKRLVAT